jgi:thiamine kinase-like enzyme
LEPESGTELRQAAVRAAAELMGVTPERIEGLTRMPGGMSNTSFSFLLEGWAYVVRLPGPGAEHLIDRDNEWAAYRALAGSGLTDEIVAIDQHGRRVTVFYEGARTADPASQADLAVAMGLARRLHESRVPLRHRFDFERQVRRYERICRATGPAPYPDLERQRLRTVELLDLRRRLGVEEVFSHCDLACDNVLILADGSARLIDWEYSALADPIMDVAMYCIYSFMERDQIDSALGQYLGRQPRAGELARLYLYVALEGYLWALWAHHKARCGQSLGDYGRRTYQYAPEYYGILMRSGLVAEALEQVRSGGGGGR